MSATKWAAESPAVASLGPLFKVTEVHLWDDAVVSFSGDSVRHDALAEELSISCTTVVANSSIKPTIDDSASVEDLELARQMDALGLPMSFSTAREKRNIVTRGRKKSTRLKSVSAGVDIENGVLGVPGVAEWEDLTSSRILHDSTNMLAHCRTREGQSEISHHDIEEEHNTGDVHSDGQPIRVLATVLSHTDKRQTCDELTDSVMSTCVFKETILEGIISGRNTDVLENSIIVDDEHYPGNGEDATSGVYQEWGLSNKQKEGKFLESSSISCHITGTKDVDADIKTLQPCFSSVESSQSCALVNNYIQEYPDNSVSCEFNDWKVVWDAFYMRNYFYNFRTQESTWYPPPGLEHFTFSCTTSNLELLADEAKEDAGTVFACDANQDQDAHIVPDRNNSFQKNKHNTQYIDQSSQEISYTKDHATDILTPGANRLAGNCFAEATDKHADTMEVSIERAPPFSLDGRDYATDELEFCECLDKQEEPITCCEAWIVPDMSVDVSINNSLTGKLNEVGCDENLRSSFLETFMTSTVDELDGHHEFATLKKKKKKARRLQSHRKILSTTESELTLEAVIEGVPANILKYWCQRYLLFSRFDTGIKMDEEGWFSVTPESIARHHASRCGSGTVIDCFTGVGGNAIQFAVRSNHVIAIDIDPQKIDYAQHNATIYGVNDRIDFVKGDFFQMPCLKGDTVFLSPPWGGPDYAKVETYDITSMLKPRDGFSLFKIARMIASRVVMFLPRNVDINQLAVLSLSVSPPWSLEVEKNFLNGRLKAITAYFSKEAM